MGCIDCFLAYEMWSTRMSDIVFGTVVFCDNGDCPHNFYGKCVTDILDMSNQKCMTGLNHIENKAKKPLKTVKKGG